MSTKTLFTILSLTLGFAIFVPYYINIFKKKARPHLFSWVTWGILGGLGFILSFLGGGGGGAWIFGLSSILCFGVVGYAIFYGEKNITRIDWAAFIAALTIAGFYVFAKNAAFSVFFVAIIDSLGFVPTFRKSYLKPHDEPALTYFLGSLSFLFSLGALTEHTFVTMFYPATLVATNFALVLFLLFRRKYFFKTSSSV